MSFLSKNVVRKISGWVKISVTQPFCWGSRKTPALRFSWTRCLPCDLSERVPVRSSYIISRCRLAQFRCCKARARDREYFLFWLFVGIKQRNKKRVLPFLGSFLHILFTRSFIHQSPNRLHLFLFDFAFEYDVIDSGSRRFRVVPDGTTIFGLGNLCAAGNFPGLDSLPTVYHVCFLTRAVTSIASDGPPGTNFQSGRPFD